MLIFRRACLNGVPFKAHILRQDIPPKVAATISYIYLAVMKLFANRMDIYETPERILKEEGKKPIKRQLPITCFATSTVLSFAK